MPQDSPSTSSQPSGAPRQWPLMAAIAFLALLLTGHVLVVGAAPPDVSASADQVRAYFHDHGSGVRLMVWMTIIAMVPFAALAAWLRQQVRGIARDVLLLGAAAYVIEETVWQWLLAGLALHPDQLDPHTARILVDIAAYAGPMLTAAVVLLAAPIAWGCLHRHNDAPAWFGWLTALVVVEQAVETVTMLGTSGFIAPGGTLNFPIGAGLFVLWVVACGAVFPARARR